MRARLVLEAAEIVFHDDQLPPALLAVGARAAFFPVEDPVAEPARLVARMGDLARAGRRVVRLYRGDPWLFSSGAREAQSLGAVGVPFAIIPGIALPVAAAAYAGIPLTVGSERMSMRVEDGLGADAATPNRSDPFQRGPASSVRCVASPGRGVAELCAALLAEGLPAATPASVIEHGLSPDQRVVTAPLGELGAAAARVGLAGTALVYVGERVQQRDAGGWYERQPLFGRRILVPRPALQAAATIAAIGRRGAAAVAFPLIEIGPAPDPPAFTAAVREMHDYDWVVFTSANGVAATFAELARQGRDLRAFGRAQVAAIGPGTASSLAARGLLVDRIAEAYVAESLADALLADGVPRRVLLLRAAAAREVLPALLRAAGTKVDVVAAYATRSLSAARGVELRALVARERVDTVLLTSGSIANSYAAAVAGPAPMPPILVASIGPITTEVARAAGLEVAVEAATYTIEGLLDALEAAAA